MLRKAFAVATAALSFLIAGSLAFCGPAAGQDKLFWIDADLDAVVSMPLDGSSAPQILNVSPAEVAGPGNQGSLDYDPATGKLYWPNFNSPENISWAAADGSGGGVLVDDADLGLLDLPIGLSLDGGSDRLFVIGYTGHVVGTAGLDGTVGTWPPTNNDAWGGPLVDEHSGRLYFTSGNNGVTYGKLDGTGSLSTVFLGEATGMNGGLAFDRDQNRLYGTFLPGGADQWIRWINPDTSTGGQLEPTGKVVSGASSLAIDHDTGEIYYMNAMPEAPEDNNTINRVSLAGGAGTQVGSEVVGAWSGGLLILKVPSTAANPVLSGGTETGAELSCGDVTWAGDRQEAHYFRSPVTTAISWTRGGQPVEGAGNKLTASVAGTYRCTRSGTNAAGTGSAQSNEIVVKDPTPPDPDPPDPDPPTNVCPDVKLSFQLSKFTPKKPYGTHNAPGVRVTFQTRGNLIVSLKPKITFHGKEGARVGNLRKHQITVHNRQRLRFLLPGSLARAIARERGEVQFAPVTFSGRATIWKPGQFDCAQKQDLKLKTRVKYVSSRQGIGLRRLP